MSRLLRLLRGEPFWLRFALHVLVAVGLVGATIISGFAEPYFTRGVWTSDAYDPIPYTDGNPMAINTFLNEEPDPATVERSLDMLAAAGFGTIRQIFGWYEIEPLPDTYVDANGRSTWEKYDRIVEMANERGIEIIARLEKPPPWSRAGQPNLTIDGPPNKLQDYADFVATVASRYKGRVRFYQIWNEPNLEGEWGGGPIDPRSYVDLLEAAYRAAKRVDPDCVILLAGLAPTEQRGPQNLSDLLFLQRVYDYGGAPFFDIATVMVYGYGYSPWDRRVAFVRNNFSRPLQTREIMVRNGDAHKAIWAAEYAWVSLPEDWDGPPSIWGNSVSAETQAKYLVEGYLRAQREWPWMGLMAVWTFRFPLPPDDPSQVGNPTRGFAIVEHDFTPRPALTALARAAPRIQRADTGSYALTDQQQAELRDGGTLVLRVSGDRLDIVVQGRGTLVVAIETPGADPPDDNGAWHSVPIDSLNRKSRISVAGDMSGGARDVFLRLEATPGGALPTVLGFVVVRHPLHTWIYPWLNSALVGTLVLVLLSLLWAVRDVRASAHTAEAERMTEEAESETIDVEPGAAERVAPLD